MMTLRERILAVYRGEQPDVVPYMLDLSHWFYHRFQKPWDLSHAYMEPEQDLIDYHKAHGAGFYIANCASFYDASFADGVKTGITKSTERGEPALTWHLQTARGNIQRTRIWEPETYSWGIRDWGIKTPEQIEIFGDAMSQRRFEPAWDRYQQWVDYVGDDGVIYMSPGYSCMGYFLSYWLGIEGTMYATMDYPDLLDEVNSQVNNNTLELVDLLCESPAEVIVMGDNFSSDVQPPHFFKRWSHDFYAEAVRRLHAAGKCVAVHVDGKLRGAIDMIRETGADCIDATTPCPMGDLTPAECREEAGPDLILSGGVSPDLWLPEVPLPVFEAAVKDWLALKDQSTRLIANAGDQVPPCADEQRIDIMRQLVEEFGRY